MCLLLLFGSWLAANKLQAQSVVTPCFVKQRWVCSSTAADACRAHLMNAEGSAFFSNCKYYLRGSHVRLNHETGQTWVEDLYTPVCQSNSEAVCLRDGIYNIFDAIGIPRVLTPPTGVTTITPTTIPGATQDDDAPEPETQGPDEPADDPADGKNDRADECLVTGTISRQTVGSDNDARDQIRLGLINADIDSPPANRSWCVARLISRSTSGSGDNCEVRDSIGTVCRVATPADCGGYTNAELLATLPNGQDWFRGPAVAPPGCTSTDTAPDFDPPESTSCPVGPVGEMYSLQDGRCVEICSDGYLATDGGYATCDRPALSGCPDGTFVLRSSGTCPTGMAACTNFATCLTYAEGLCEGVGETLVKTSFVYDDPRNMSFRCQGPTNYYGEIDDGGETITDDPNDVGDGDADNDGINDRTDDDDDNDGISDSVDTSPLGDGSTVTVVDQGGTATAGNTQVDVRPDGVGECDPTASNYAECIGLTSEEEDEDEGAGAILEQLETETSTAEEEAGQFISQVNPVERFLTSRLNNISVTQPTGCPSLELSIPGILGRPATMQTLTFTNFCNVFDGGLRAFLIAFCTLGFTFAFIRRMQD